MPSAASTISPAPRTPASLPSATEVAARGCRENTVIVEDLPPLTGSALLDPWRIRLRLALAGELEPPPRQPPTRSELVLWDRLQGDSPPWVREYPTGPYRLDFYCPLVKLAVEVDGSSHWGNAANKRDDHRDAWHALRGIDTKRFSAREVESDPAWVHREIGKLVEIRIRLDAQDQLRGLDSPTDAPLPSLAGNRLRQGIRGPGAAACETVLPDRSLDRGPLRQLLSLTKSSTQHRRRTGAGDNQPAPSSCVGQDSVRGLQRSSSAG